jgi:L-iditol 2-dehydrogenase
VTATGVCGSDLHWFSEAGIGDARVVKPLVLGHESAGVIVSGSESGQRVAIDPAIPCGQCEYCQAGNPNLCKNLVFAGSAPDDGTLREYLVWPAHCLHPLPDALTDADGAMLEPLGVAIHAVDLGHVKPGMTVGDRGSTRATWTSNSSAARTPPGNVRIIQLDSKPSSLRVW